MEFEEDVMEYDYKVWREGNSVFYNIFNNKGELTKRQVDWHELNFITAVFWVRPESERCIEKLFKLAHKLAKKGILVLKEQQRL